MKACYSKYRLKFLLFSTTLEIIIVAVLGFNIYQKQGNVLGAASVTPLEQDDLLFNTSKDLKYFYEPKPGIRVDNTEWLPSPVENSINSDTLNERFEYSIQKPPDVYRIITLGDSFTYGLHVNTPENYPEKLEDLLNDKLHCQNIKKFEVINLGVGGYDLHYVVERFKLRGQKYNPDLVIWFLIDSDFQRFNELTLPKIKTLRQEMRQNGEEQIAEEKGIYNPEWKQVLRDFEKEHSEQDRMQIQKSYLDELANHYKRELLFITFPFIKDKNKNFLENYITVHIESQLYTNLSDIYEQGAFLEDKHPNAAGYTLIANNLYNYLVDSNSIPCN